MGRDIYQIEQLAVRASEEMNFSANHSSDILSACSGCEIFDNTTMSLRFILLVHIGW
jgi:hypothetical protein